MRIKTSEDIAVLTFGGALLAEILGSLLKRVAVGVSGIELNELAVSLMRKAGGEPAFFKYGNPPFPAALCVSVNDCVVHGIPSHAQFAAGDVVSLDIGMKFRGLITDTARTVVLPPQDQEDVRMVNAARDALDAAIAVIAPGVTTGDLGHAVQSFIEPLGYGIVRDLAGHGVGHSLHEEPLLPNFGSRGEGMRLEAGMVIALEPMITRGSHMVRIGKDRWGVFTQDHSRAAHWEDTIVVTPEGSKVITR